MEKQISANTLPEISIIIITLNEEKTLPVLLQELAEQSYQNFQLIISDSNSNDSTQEVAQKYAHVGMSYVFHNCGVTKGPGYGRNQWALLANHEILLFLDADTGLPNKHFIEDTLKFYLNHNLDIAWCYVRSKTNNFLHKIGCFITNLIARYYQKKFPLVPGWYILNKKMFHFRVNWFDESINLWEDSWYVKHCRDAWAKFGRMPYKFLFDMRRIEQKGAWYMAKVYWRWFIMTVIQGERLDSLKTQDIDYDFDIYKQEKSR